MPLPASVIPLQLDLGKYGKGSEIVFCSELDSDKSVFPVVLNWNKKQRFAIKVKCNDNTRYRLNPVFAIVEPESYMEIEIKRMAGESEEPGKVAIHYAPVWANVKNAMDFWMKETPPLEELDIDIINQVPGVLPLQLNLDKYGKGSEIIFRPPFDSSKTVVAAVLNWNKKQRFAIKVKCSDNTRYKLNPVFAIVEPKCYEEIEITRMAGDFGQPGKVAIHYAPVTADETNPMKFWMTKKPAFEQLSIDIINQVPKEIF